MRCRYPQGRTRAVRLHGEILQAQARLARARDITHPAFRRIERMLNCAEAATHAFHERWHERRSQLLEILIILWITIDIVIHFLP